MDPFSAAEEHKTREIMLPPERYPQVYSWVSIREAMVALTASAVQLKDEHLIPPRYVLVLDESDSLVGILTRRSLIRGLEPHLGRAGLPQKHLSSLAPYEEPQHEMSMQWTSLFSNSALEASRRPVSAVMEPIKGLVGIDEPLSHVITKMIDLGVDIIPVVDGEKVAGVVLMTDIFDIVAQFVIEQGGRGASGKGTS
jgi:CBS domain-containing protein